MDGSVSSSYQKSLDQTYQNLINLWTDAVRSITACSLTTSRPILSLWRQLAFCSHVSQAPSSVLC